jgi:LPXTG-site transpeptidase (sortase) family protein
MLAFGVMLLAAAGTYYAYVTFIAPRGSDQLIVAPADDVRETLDTQPVVGAAPSAAALYPGTLLPARQWADPRGSLDIPVANLTGFTPLSSQARPSIQGAEGMAAHMSIPAIGVDAGVDEIEILSLDNASAYLTPAFTVGHIPGTPNPGSHGNGWYFGHLESPVAGEGNVFTRLPRIPDMLRNGEEVHVILRTGLLEYLYVVTQTDLVDEEDMALYQASDARITLVTCYPRLRYDQRLLVTAQLIGVRAVAA